VRDVSHQTAFGEVVTHVYLFYVAGRFGVDVFSPHSRGRAGCACREEATAVAADDAILDRRIFDFLEHSPSSYGNSATRMSFAVSQPLND
jgi:hypothetical protein